MDSHYAVSRRAHRSWGSPDHESRDRWTNDELRLLSIGKDRFLVEELDGGKFRRHFYTKFSPTLARLQDHRLGRAKKRTIWLTNSTKHPVLMCLFDVDLDPSAPFSDVDGAAAYIATKYFGGRTFVEPSSAQRGRHGYFFVDVEFVKRTSFADALKALGKTIKADPHLVSFNVKIDPQPIYGLPTIWRPVEGKSYREIACRGNQLKAPYLHGGLNDLAKMVTLASHPLSGAEIVSWHQRQARNESSPPSPLASPVPVNTDSAEPQHGRHQTYSATKSAEEMQNGRASVSPTPPVLVKADSAEGGPRRRARLYRDMKLADAGLTEDQFVAAYSILTPENGGEEKVRRDFRKMDRKFVLKPTVPVWDAGRYEGAVEVIPPLALVTEKRRTKLSHKRVAEFVALKMQDCFQANAWQGIAGKKASLRNWATLKEKGLVDWTLTENAYASLVKVCVRYGLLEIIEDWTPPTSHITGDWGIGVKKGRTRRIGPGPALPTEHERFASTKARLLRDSPEAASRRRTA